MSLERSKLNEWSKVVIHNRRCETAAKAHTPTHTLTTHTKHIGQ